MLNCPKCDSQVMLTWKKFLNYPRDTVVCENCESKLTILVPNKIRIPLLVFWVFGVSGIILCRVIFIFMYGMVYSQNISVIFLISFFLWIGLGTYITKFIYFRFGQLKAIDAPAINDLSMAKQTDEVQHGSPDTWNL